MGFPVDSLKRGPADAIRALAVLLAGFACPAAEADARNVLDYGALFEVEAASDPQISPDGTRVIYVRRSGDVMTDRSYSRPRVVVEWTIPAVPGKPASRLGVSAARIRDPPDIARPG